MHKDQILRRLPPVCGAATVLLLILAADVGGWGWNAHRFINRTAVYHLPGEMMLFIQDSSFFATHSIDADQRRISGDTSFHAEAPRHYLDIDDYPNFQTIPRNLDSLIAMFGWQRVKQNGTNPWATIWNYDSLVAQLTRGDWVKAKLTASDIGHYVGDAHQPLHCTINYDGQFTNQRGIHARYETTMLSPTYYLSALSIVPDSIGYIADRINFIFDYIIHSNSLLDTVLQADLHAKVVSGWNGTGTNAPATYYAALWDRTRTITLQQMQGATNSIAALWYTAWVDAGLITTSVGDLPAHTTPTDLRLDQNYPNPFNPVSTISYSLPVGGTVSLKVFSLDGREVATLMEGNQSAGEHSVLFDATGLSSGVYLYRLQLGGFAQTKKLVLVK
jgi:hypothetical protein